MGVGELRDAFNSVAGPQFTAQRAFLSYEMAHDIQWQRLSFEGVDANGKSFIAKSDLLRPETHLITAAQATAQNLLANPPKVTP